MDYFRSNRAQTVSFGRHILEEQLQSLGYTLDDKLKKTLMKAYGVTSEDDLFLRIGLGTLKLNNLSEILRKDSEGTSLLRRFFRRDPKESGSPAERIILGRDGGTKYIIASCCHPIPGDPVVGFRGPDGAVTVHKKSCAVAEELASTHGDWVVVPKWEESVEDNSFPVRLSLQGLDRVGLLNEISRYISLVMGINIRRLTLASDGGIFEGFIDFYVSSRDVLDKMIRKLSGIEGIQNVVRTDL